MKTDPLRHWYRVPVAAGVSWLNQWAFQRFRSVNAAAHAVPPIAWIFIPLNWLAVQRRVGFPQQWPLRLTPKLMRMKGTDEAAPRCIALTGEVGQQVGCSIYAKPPIALP